MASRIKALIFDLDGTLVDTSRDITEAINYAIEPYGLKHITVEETIGLVGEGITRLIEKVLKDKVQYRDETIKRFLDYYSKNLTKYSMPYEGIKETLEKLDKYKKVVVSNKREALSRRLLEELKMDIYFDYILGSDSTPEKKPSPVPIFKALELTGVAPDEALMIGDSNLDIQAGHSAGVKTVAVLYGYRPYEMLKDADYFIREDMSEIVGILKALEE
jgi:phosphoglycolate phosphatase